jgi:hypothetical protein
MAEPSSDDVRLVQYEGEHQLQVHMLQVHPGPQAR